MTDSKTGQKSDSNVTDMELSENINTQTIIGILDEVTTEDGVIDATIEEVAKLAEAFETSTKSQVLADLNIGILRNINNLLC